MDPKTLAIWKARQETPLPYPETSFAGKTVIVTGSNTGLGLEAARHFVNCKASRVIMAVRSESKGEAAKADIEASTGIRDVIQVWSLDLSSYASIKAFIKRIQTLDRVDAVVQNAGLAMGTYVEAEGTEMQMTVNVYGTFLFVMLLLPVLKETARKFSVQPVLNVVASNSGFMLPFQERGNEHVLETLEQLKPLSTVYSLSKIIQILVIRELGATIAVDSGVIINCLNPGICVTDLTRNADEQTLARVNAMRSQMGRTAEVGSRTLFHSTVAGPESHGKFLSECHIADDELPSWILQEDDGGKVQKKVWNELQEKLNKIEPGCVAQALAI